MKRGVVGGIAVCLLFVASWPVCATRDAVFVNGEVLSLDPPILEEGGSILVPVEGFGLALGVETTAEADRLLLRWSGGRRSLTTDRCAIRDGVAYATLEWMAGLVGADLHRVGETWYVETSPATLEEMEATTDGLILRFDGFVPITVDEAPSGKELRLTLHHCRTDVPAQLTVLGGSTIDSIRLPIGVRDRVEIQIVLGDAAVVCTSTYDSGDFYSYALEASDRPGMEMVLQIDDRIVLHRLSESRSAGAIRADWLYVEAWRDRYRLAPVFPMTGFETLAPIEDLAASSGAVAAINLGCPRTAAPIDVLIANGRPYTVCEGADEGLGLDLFGWWTYYSAEASVYAKHGGGRIRIDDVNRQLLYGEVVAYPPGYVGAIARGVPGTFTVIKVRSDRVVSVYEGPFVAADPTAMLVVASGEAKPRLSLIRLGDALSVECGFGHDGLSFEHAFSAGPILIDSGTPVDLPETSSETPARGWTVLATDWHGGLILLAFELRAGSAEEATGELMELLAAMPVPIRDAIVIGRCSGGALAVRDRSSIYRLGSGEPFALALCLVPLSP